MSFRSRLIQSAVRVGALLAGVLTLAYPALCAFFFFNQERFLFFPQKLPDRLVFPFKGVFEEVVLPVEGARLSAVLFRAERSRGLVIYFHGNAGSMVMWESVRWPFLEAGYDFLLVDYRGYGKSTGRIRREADLLRDGQAVYDWAKSRFPEDQIVLCGRSLGSSVAAYLAKENRPKLLILESPYVSILDMKRRLYPFLPDFLVRYPLRTDRWLTEVRCPVHLLHGRQDAVVPHDASVHLWSLVRHRGGFETIEGAGHDDLSEFPEHDEALQRILR